MILAEADPHSQHLSPTSASGLRHWPGDHSVGEAPNRGNQGVDAHPNLPSQLWDQHCQQPGKASGRNWSHLRWLQLHLQDIIYENHKQEPQK